MTDKMLSQGQTNAFLDLIIKRNFAFMLGDWDSLDSGMRECSDVFLDGFRSDPVIDNMFNKIDTDPEYRDRIMKLDVGEETAFDYDSGIGYIALFFLMHRLGDTCLLLSALEKFWISASTPQMTDVPVPGQPLFDVPLALKFIEAIDTSETYYNRLPEFLDHQYGEERDREEEDYLLPNLMPGLSEVRSFINIALSYL